MISKIDIETTLKTVIDPELGYNIVDLGLIYNIDLTPKPSTLNPNITIVMTLTSPGCPLAPYFINQIKEVVSTAAHLTPDQIDVDITFDPPWSPEALSADMRLQLGL
jgi:metal-sulfur cluster biosynthetic enzyme